MELRTLKYFLTLVQEGNVSNAAKALHITQPTLSRQLAALENDLGKQLYERGNKRISLTEDGAVLYRYARSIVELTDRAESELALPTKATTGNVYIGAGETYAMALLAQAMIRVQQTYPGITFHLSSGSTVDLMDKLEKGLLDFILECEVPSRVSFNIIELPYIDTWGVLVRNDSALARLDSISPADLEGERLILSRQGLKTNTIQKWAGDAFERFNVVATYNLALNSKFLVEEGLGCSILYKGLVDVSESGSLRFVPLEPKMESKSGIIWKKKAKLSKQAEVFLDELKELIETRPTD